MIFYSKEYNSGIFSMNIRYLAIALVLFVLAISDVSAHSGRTDAYGGHNCYVGACAGTYHYHNGGSVPAPYVAPKTVASPKPSPKPTFKPTPSQVSSPSPTPSATPTPSPEVKGETTTLEPINTQNTSPDNLTTETSAGDTALGLGLLTAIIGGGYWGIRKLMRKIKT